MAAGNYPPELRYHAEHGWALIGGDQATLGISWFAQDALGEVVFFDPPEPLSGEVTEVNRALEVDAELINSEPYGAGWLVKIRISGAGDADLLLSAEAYEATLS